MDQLNSIKDWTGFVRNPLGLIAVFIFLIYSVASILLGVGLRFLCGPYERLPLIYFIIVFPIIVLFVFYRLVTKHHHKLYGPRDFRNDQGFYGVIVSSSETPQTEMETDELIHNLESAQSQQTNSAVSQAIEYIKKSKKQSFIVPVNEKYWRLNHWGSNYAVIRNNSIVFSGDKRSEFEDGCHIDIINSLVIGKKYKIRLEATNTDSDGGHIKLWCHDNYQASTELSSVDSGLIQPTLGRSTEISIDFKAIRNPDVRIHVQYVPGKGSTIVRDVRILEIED